MSRPVWALASNRDGCGGLRTFPRVMLALAEEGLRPWLDWGLGARMKD